MRVPALVVFLVACGPDADMDGILDVDEAVGDHDYDGVDDRFDRDADGDRIPDAVEAGDDDPLTPPVDADEDGIPDFLDRDADGDCVDDRVLAPEVYRETWKPPRGCVAPDLWPEERNAMRGAARGKWARRTR
jgi:hypothetical protein